MQKAGGFVIQSLVSNRNRSQLSSYATKEKASIPIHHLQPGLDRVCDRVWLKNGATNGTETIKVVHTYNCRYLDAGYASSSSSKSELAFEKLLVGQADIAQ